MQPDDLPLFRWEPPRRVLLFPLARRVGKVQHVARLLMTKQGEDADLYWRQVLAGLRKHFDRVGVPPDQAEAEVRAFFDAVQGEMARLSYSDRRPGGAA